MEEEKIPDYLQIGIDLHQRILYGKSPVAEAIETVHRVDLAVNSMIQVMSHQPGYRFLSERESAMHSWKVSEVYMSNPVVDYLHEFLSNSSQLGIISFNPIMDNHTLDSFKYMRSTRLPIDLWREDDIEEEWKEEYIEGQEHKTTPL